MREKDLARLTEIQAARAEQAQKQKRAQPKTPVEPPKALAPSKEIGFVFSNNPLKIETAA